MEYRASSLECGLHQAGLEHGVPGEPDMTMGVENPAGLPKHRRTTQQIMCRPYLLSWASILRMIIGVWALGRLITTLCLGHGPP